MFRIGAFSKITQVAGSQLRYYDEIGLLNPAKIDEWTGYRYYSATQIPRLNQILVLKGLGLTLEQIRKMIDDDISADEIRGMFILKKAQLEKEMQEDLVRLQQIDSRIRQIEDTGIVDKYDVVIKSVPPLSYLSYRQNMPNFGEAFATLSEMRQLLPTIIDKKELGYITAILHSENFGEEIIDVEVGQILLEKKNDPLLLPSGKELTVRTLAPIDQMLTTIFLGIPQTSHQCRAFAASWMEDNGYQLDGHGREVFIVPPIPGKEDEAVLEIQYPVKKNIERKIYSQIDV